MEAEKTKETTRSITMEEVAYLTTIQQLSDENNRLRNRVNYLELLIVELKQARKEEETTNVESNG